MRTPAGCRGDSEQLYREEIQMKDAELLVASYQNGCQVLGPGKRFVIWVQGCHFSCPGCIAQSMKSLDGGTLVSVRSLSETILNTPDLEGITVSGGEPFLQAEELSVLFSEIRKKSNLGIIVYTGFYYEQLKQMEFQFPEIGQMLSQIDMLIDGPYVEEQNFDYGWKGSVNQKNYLLTDRYRDYLYLYGESTSRKIEMYPDGQGTFMAGVPSRYIKKQWEKIRTENQMICRQ